MKLADSIEITVGDEVIELRPRLRHALCIERREGSFAGLMREVAEGSLSAAYEIIRPHRTKLTLDEVFTASLSGLTLPLINYIGQCTGIDPDDIPADGKAKGKPVTLGEHLTGLYRIGTGWLGWTPAQTLDATPAEITEAFNGRLEMLKAIFGSGDKASPAKDDRPLDEKFRSIFATHGTVKVEA